MRSGGRGACTREMGGQGPGGRTAGWARGRLRRGTVGRKGTGARGQASAGCDLRAHPACRSQGERLPGQGLSERLEEK